MHRTYNVSHEVGRMAMGEDFGVAAGAYRFLRASKSSAWPPSTCRNSVHDAKYTLTVEEIHPSTIRCCGRKFSP